MRKKVKDIKSGDVLYIVDEKKFTLTEHKVRNNHSEDFKDRLCITFDDNEHYMQALPYECEQSNFRYMERTVFIYREDAEMFFNSIAYLEMVRLHGQIAKCDDEIGKLNLKIYK